MIMKCVHGVILFMILLTFTFGNTNLTDDKIEVRKCTDQDETCEMRTIIQGDTLFTNSVEINRNGKFVITNETDQLLFYLIEKSDILFQDNHKYDTVVIDSIKYLYLAVPGDSCQSDKLHIKDTSSSPGSYTVQIFGICRKEIKASPQIIVKNGGLIPKNNK